MLEHEAFIGKTLLNCYNSFYGSYVSELFGVKETLGVFEANHMSATKNTKFAKWRAHFRSVLNLSNLENALKQWRRAERQKQASKQKNATSTFSKHNKNKRLEMKCSNKMQNVLTFRVCSCSIRKVSNFPRLHETSPPNSKLNRKKGILSSPTAPYFSTCYVTS